MVVDRGTSLGNVKSRSLRLSEATGLLDSYLIRPRVVVRQTVASSNMGPPCRSGIALCMAEKAASQLGVPGFGLLGIDHLNAPDVTRIPKIGFKMENLIHSL